MSKGRYRLMWTFLADLVSLALSYVYGAAVIPWIGGWMWHPLDVAVVWLYEHFFLLLPLPHPLQAAYLHNAGLTWLTIALLFRLLYLVRWMHQRSTSKDLAKPHAGTPGDAYYENVRRRFADYQAALERWEPKIELRLPTWRYYKRRTTNQPDMFWRGRTLVIEKSLLEPDRLQELQPELACELMYYQCEDIAFRDILAYYHLGSAGYRQFWFNLLGLYFSWPIALINELVWPDYWNERVSVADEFAFGAGQGPLLYFQVDAKIQQEEALKQERGELAREIAQLQERWNAFQNKANIQDWTIPGEDPNERSSYHTYDGYSIGSSSNSAYGRFTMKWSELTQQIAELKQRDHRLGEQEAKLHEVRPMLEERRGLLAARLGSEQTWRKQHGIPPPSQTAALQERRSRLG